ncbi:GNAT family N-acetyltransferase [Sphingobacterium psychroaquaticum]|uniref:GNAT family N-acetyltransferase n=1 Tax=Sphingobacterium psychroaquaticum TaxID=561061 RepID=UPI00106AA893|nr:GNAT family N-acetyltransferase [Sphingobacterium psychroaquaticum]QBQ42794.1 GNAT family N-acetyltransferase [Sphingobacterium psychroaquaticum]
MEIVTATAEHWTTIAQIATLSWQTGYAGILSDQQIDFMLNKAYVEQDFEGATALGNTFFLIKDEEKEAGFITLLSQEDRLRIEKLYLLPSVQGKGLGKTLIDFAAEHALNNGIDVLELNVNRGNKHAYAFYIKQGFVVTETVDIPYFDYVLDDYVMQKRLRK